MEVLIMMLKAVQMKKIMSYEEDDGGDILKELLSTQSRDKFLPAKRTRKIRLKNSVIKNQMRTKRKVDI
jgi:hypothetical protein